MAYCLYLRKSRADLEAEAHGEGETLARHEKALLDLSQRMKLKIDCVYREIVSGETIAARPVMQQLLSDVEQGMWDGVLVMEVERLARGDTIDQGIVAQTFKFTGTKIITPLKTYDPNNEYDEEYFEFGLFMSRREYKTINRRLQRGRIASVKEGKFVGNKAPFGYVRKKLDKEKGYTLIPDSEKVSAVKIIFSLYAYGEKRADGSFEEMGTSKIARRLDELKIPSVTGKSWAASTIQGILRNPVYIGKIRWNARPSKKKMIGGKIVKKRPRTKSSDWILADGLHQPIIDQKTWYTVQQRLSDHPICPCPKNAVIANPMAGLVVCGKCGRKMIRRPCTNPKHPDIMMCPSSSCNNISSALDCIEQHLLEALRQWLDQYELTYKPPHDPECSEQTEIKQKALRNAQDELEKLEKQRDTIYNLLEQGTYTADVFLERSKSINNKIEKSRENISRLSQDIQLLSKAAKNQKIIIPKTEHILTQYGNAKTPAEKNRLLKSVLEKVVYTKTVNGRWHNKPDDFELILYPKLPRSKIH